MFRSQFHEASDDPTIFSGDVWFVKQTSKSFILLVLMFHELVYPCSKIVSTGKMGSHTLCRQFVVNQVSSAGII